MSSAPSTSTAESSTAGKNVPSNPRGIPQAVFISGVEEFLGSPDADAEPELAKLNELLSKYRFMEKTFSTKRAGLEEKIPDFKSTLEMCELLVQKKEEEEVLTTHFELTETLYAKAEVPPVEEVYLWLGANTMLSYPPQEAIALLSSKLQTATTNLEHLKQDLLYLREQITTTEVNIARIYNWDVKRRRERRLAREAAGQGEEEDEEK